MSFAASARLAADDAASTQLRALARERRGDRPADALAAAGDDDDLALEFSAMFPPFIVRLILASERRRRH